MQKMSEKEAIEELKCYRACSGTQLPTEIEAAIEALKELSQYKQGGLVLIPADVYQRQCDELDAYKAIGTVDQCREAVERMKPKKPVKVHDMEDLAHTCFVECHCGAMNHTDIEREVIYCWKCGNLLDWSE